MSNLSNNISIIVFSKDRPLQLQGYLESLLNFSNIDASSITVLYKFSSLTNYQKLINEFSKVTWIKEQFFFEDLLTVINHSKDYIMFGCDDVVFKDYFDFSIALSHLTENENIFGFSTRLGENIRPLPENIQRHENILQWYWMDTGTHQWNYPWELDATIYRKADVINIVTMLDPAKMKNPNFLEGEVANHPKQYISKQELSSFKTGKCIVLTINRVQDDFLNEYDKTFNADIETLYKLYNDGVKVDFISISKKKNNSIHVGAEFLKLKSDNNYKSLLLYFQIYWKRIFAFSLNTVGNIFKKMKTK